MTKHEKMLRWWERDTAPGYVLLAATIASFALLNAPFSHVVHDILEHAVAVVSAGGIAHPLTLHFAVNDGLMAIFFLYVGLELKRETVEGPFANPREAALPIIAAAGGMAAPALIYLAIAGGGDPEYARGWAIPAATDIAFAIGVLALLGTRVPANLRLFLLALAIIDDLGAILVIALFYASVLVGWALGCAAIVFIVMLMLNRAGVRAPWPYWLLGFALWAFMLLSGVHATVAGVLTALTVPMRRPDGGSPLTEAEHALKPWVLLAIMPIFAIVNAGISLEGLDLSVLAHPVTLGVGLGLLVGKPLGIFVAVALGARVLKFPLPGDAASVFGVALLAGIGFTMSLFIGGLAFGDGDLAAPTRVGVLTGSMLSALAGLALLSRALPARKQGTKGAE